MTFLSDHISEPRAFSSRLCAWAVFCVLRSLLRLLRIFNLDSAIITTQAYREDNR